MSWKESFAEGKEIVLATCSKNNPNANLVVSLGFVDDKLLVADCQMKNTIKNLKENNKICVIGGYFRMVGEAEIYNSGKYFDLCVEKSKGYKVRHAILIRINEVFDLDGGRVVSSFKNFDNLLKKTQDFANKKGVRREDLDEAVKKSRGK